MGIRVEIVTRGSGPGESRPEFPESGGRSNSRSPCPSPEPPMGSQHKDSGCKPALPDSSPRAAPGQDHPAPAEPEKPPTSPERSRPAAAPQFPPRALPTPGGPGSRPGPAARSDTARWERGARQIRRKPSGFIGKERSALPGTRLSPSSPH